MQQGAEQSGRSSCSWGAWRWRRRGARHRVDVGARRCWLRRAGRGASACVDSLRVSEGCLTGGGAAAGVTASPVAGVVDEGVCMDSTSTECVLLYWLDSSAATVRLWLLVCVRCKSFEKREGQRRGARTSRDTKSTVAWRSTCCCFIMLLQSDARLPGLTTVCCELAQRQRAAALQSEAVAVCPRHAARRGGRGCCLRARRAGQRAWRQRPGFAGVREQGVA